MPVVVAPHEPETQSLPVMHFLPAAQRARQIDPPQSLSVSSSFWIPSVQVAGCVQAVASNRHVESWHPSVPPAKPSDAHGALYAAVPSHCSLPLMTLSPHVPPVSVTAWQDVLHVMHVELYEGVHGVLVLATPLSHCSPLSPWITPSPQ